MVAISRCSGRVVVAPGVVSRVRQSGSAVEVLDFLFCCPNSAIGEKESHQGTRGGLGKI